MQTDCSKKPPIPGHRPIIIIIFIFIQFLLEVRCPDVKYAATYIRGTISVIIEDSCMIWVDGVGFKIGLIY
jgi:hypothetical protein